MEQINKTQITSTTDLPVTIANPNTTTVQRSTVTVTKSTAEIINGVIWFIFGLIEVLLALRIVFLLLGGRASGFAAFLYDITSPFVVPFQGIFNSPAAEGAYFDTAAILAVFIFALLAWGITSLIEVIMSPGTSQGY